MSLTGRQSILQIHPTRLCNLRCRHCYSESGPDARETLPADLVLRTVRDAAALGYGTLSVSGGEPLMYPELIPVLATARSHGMRTLVTTNGTLLTDGRLSRLAPELDLLAISLDGPPAEHDLMRARSGAFEKLQRGLPALRRAGIPFGFLITLTQFNAHHLEWAAEFAAEQGAVMLQVHPLQPTGRGQQLAGELPDGIEQAYTALEVARLRVRFVGRLRIEYDVVSRPALATLAQQTSTLSGLADWVSPLVLEPDGVLVPMEYGFPRDWVVADVRRQNLAEVGPTWCRLAEFRLLCLEVLDRLQDQDAAPLSYWYAEIRAAAAGPLAVGRCN